jgi:hypothetical protein
MQVRRSIHAAAVIAMLFAWQRAMANPTQEEVFKSIQDNVGAPTDYRNVLLFLSVAAGAIILLAVFGQRRKGDGASKIVNHHGKLLKEITKSVAIRPREIKQLKALCEQTPLPDGEHVRNPLTLVLCPSVLARAVQNPRCKADRRVLQQVLRRSVATANLVQAVSASVVRPVSAKEKARQISPGRPLEKSRALH